MVEWSNKLACLLRLMSLFYEWHPRYMGRAFMWYFDRLGSNMHSHKRPYLIIPYEILNPLFTVTLVVPSQSQKEVTSNNHVHWRWLTSYSRNEPSIRSYTSQFSFVLLCVLAWIPLYLILIRFSLLNPFCVYISIEMIYTCWW